MAPEDGRKVNSRTIFWDHLSKIIIGSPPVGSKIARYVPSALGKILNNFN
jgi:hypothetical protein